MMTQMRCLSTPMRFLFVFKLCQGTIRSRSAMSFIVPLSAPKSMKPNYERAIEKLRRRNCERETENLRQKNCERSHLKL